MSRFAEAIALLDAAVGPVFPSAACVVLHRGVRVLGHATGSASLDTVFDLASLTKPMVCATTFAQGRLPLTGGAEHLLGHTSGLPAHRDLRPQAPPGTPAAIAEIKARVLAEPLECARGERAIYSDLGYMRLGWHLEDRLGCTLEELFSAIAADFGLPATGYRPTPGDPGVAPTEDCRVRGRVVRGEVHDLNCWYLGGVGGHAGLFGTAGDVARWAQGLLDAYLGQRSPAFGALVARLWRSEARSAAPTTWRLGFDSMSPGTSSAGSLFGPASVGHLGFTGTSVWIDPQARLVCVLLSNRVHPRVVENPPIKRLRPAFHDAVFRGIQTT